MLFGVCGVLCALPFFLQDRSMYALESSSTDNKTTPRADRQIPMCDTQNITMAKESDNCLSMDTAGELANTKLSRRMTKPTK